MILNSVLLGRDNYRFFIVLWKRVKILKGLFKKVEENVDVK